MNTIRLSDDQIRRIELFWEEHEAEAQQFKSMCINIRDLQREFMQIIRGLSPSPNDEYEEEYVACMNIINNMDMDRLIQIKTEINACHNGLEEIKSNLKLYQFNYLMYLESIGIDWNNRTYEEDVYECVHGNDILNMGKNWYYGSRYFDDEKFEYMEHYLLNYGCMPKEPY